MTAPATGAAAPGIFVALGANLASALGPPRVTLAAALDRLEAAGATVVARSPWYETAPVPAMDQPWFVNGVVELACALAPEALLGLLHEIEQALGRTRRARWEARVIDLDLVDYRGLVRRAGRPILPHPRLAERAFVLRPLADIAPAWRHPQTGRAVADLVAALPPDQAIRRLE